MGWLTCVGIRFTAPARLEHEEHLRHLYAIQGRLILCAGHFALNSVVLRVLIDLAHSPFVLSSAHLLQVEARRRTDGWVGGTEDTVPILKSSPSVLLQARKYLKRGGVMVVAADGGVADAEPAGGRCGEPHISAGIFWFALLMASPVLFFASFSDRDGDIRVIFEMPVCSVPHTAVDIGQCQDQLRHFIGQCIQRSQVATRRGFSR